MTVTTAALESRNLAKGYQCITQDCLRGQFNLGPGLCRACDARMKRRGTTDYKYDTRMCGECQNTFRTESTNGCTKCDRCKAARRIRRGTTDYFWTKIDQSDLAGHWRWKPRDPERRRGKICIPRTTIDGRTDQVHRQAWRLTKGSEPPPKLTRSCEVDWCINPNHCNNY